MPRDLTKLQLGLILLLGLALVTGGWPDREPARVSEAEQAAKVAELCARVLADGGQIAAAKALPLCSR